MANQENDASSHRSDQATIFLERLFARVPEDLWAVLWTLPDKRSWWFPAKHYMHIAETAISLAEDHDVYIAVSLFTRDHGPRSRGKLDDVAGILGL